MTDENSKPIFFRQIEKYDDESRYPTGLVASAREMDKLSRFNLDIKFKKEELEVMRNELCSKRNFYYFPSYKVIFEHMYPTTYMNNLKKFLTHQDCYDPEFMFYSLQPYRSIFEDSLSTKQVITGLKEHLKVGSVFDIEWTFYCPEKTGEFDFLVHGWIKNFCSLDKLIMYLKKFHNETSWYRDVYERWVLNMTEETNIDDHAFTNKDIEEFKKDPSNFVEVIKRSNYPEASYYRIISYLFSTDRGEWPNLKYLRTFTDNPYKFWLLCEAEVLMEKLQKGKPRFACTEEYTPRNINNLIAYIKDDVILLLSLLEFLVTYQETNAIKLLDDIMDNNGKKLEDNKVIESFTLSLMRNKFDFTNLLPQPSLILTDINPMIIGFIRGWASDNKILRKMSNNLTENCITITSKRMKIPDFLGKMTKKPKLNYLKGEKPWDELHLEVENECKITNGNVSLKWNGKTLTNLGTCEFVYESNHLCGYIVKNNILIAKASLLRCPLLPRACKERQTFINLIDKIEFDESFKNLIKRLLVGGYSDSFVEINILSANKNNKYYS